MGIAKPAFRVQADFFQRPDGKAVACLRAQPRLVNRESFADDLGNGHAWRERAEGILKDDLHLAPERTQRRAPQPIDWPAGETDRAIAFDQAQEGEAEGRLAGAALAYDAQGMALMEGEGDAVDGLDIVGDPAQ